MDKNDKRLKETAAQKCMGYIRHLTLNTCVRFDVDNSGATSGINRSVVGIISAINCTRVVPISCHRSPLAHIRSIRFPSLSNPAFHRRVRV